MLNEFANTARRDPRVRKIGKMDILDKTNTYNNGILYRTKFCATGILERAGIDDTSILYRLN